MRKTLKVIGIALAMILVICIVNNAIKFDLTELYKVCPLIGIDKKSIERGLQR